MFRLVRYLKKFKVQVILGPIFKLTEAILELFVPLVMAKIIDVGIHTGDTSYILNMGALMILIGVVGLAAALTCQYLASRTSQGVGTQLRSDLFSHINQLSNREIDKLGTPSLITRITNDVNRVQVAVAMLIRLMPRAPFLVIGAAIMTVSIDAKLSIIFFIAALVIGLILYLVMTKSIPYFKGIQKKLDKVSLITRENLFGMRVIRAFSKQKKEEKRFDEAADDLCRASVRVGRLSALLNPLTTVAVNLGIIALLWFGGLQVNTGDLTQGEIIALVNYMNQILLAMIVLANVIVVFTKASASATRINEVLETKSTVVETADKPVTTPQGVNTPRVEFINVSFGYHQTGEPAIRGLNLSVKAGETIGIIGGTGAGKSTLVNLIPRFYDPTEGQVLVDGVDIEDYPFAQLRGKIGIVPQRAVLFAGTLRQNMSWRDEKATDEEIGRALSISQSADFVGKMTDGYDSEILQEGKNLSGGQRQRLTIARALVGNPEILILDDSASALDFATDAALRRAIKQDCKGVTIFLVSQRVNTVMGADRIVVLDDGEVAGIGTHAQLFKSCEVYHEICLSQLSQEEVERQ